MKISVVTVCFNAADTIETTIRSVLSQAYPEIEYVIVDGDSTDGTQAIVQRYADRIDKFVSGKDGGIYDAMNKGIALSTGDIVYFLNADDRLFDDGVLVDVVRAFAESPSRVLVYGKVKPENVPAHILPFLKDDRRIGSIKDFIRYTLCHQAVFAKRELFAVFGGFDCKYRFAADYEWLIKVFRSRHADCHFVDRYVAHYHYMGRSFQGDSLTRREKTRIQRKHLFSIEFVLYYFRYVLVRGMKKKLLRETY